MTTPFEAKARRVATVISIKGHASIAGHNCEPPYA
jgi:hypothetical protein